MTHEQILDEIGMLYECFYKMGCPLEQCTSFESICEKVPELAEIWNRYCEAKIIFEYNMEKLMEKYRLTLRRT